MPRILVVDDDRDLEQLLVEYIRERGLEVVGCNSAAQALMLLQERPFEIVLTDLKMKAMGGLDLLKSICARYPDVRVIIMTAFGSVETAISAMKLGAFDFLTKPFKMELVGFTLDRALRAMALNEENARLKKELQRQSGFQDIVGKAKPMRDIFSLIKRIGPSASTVMIYGESGTGKELVARAIHRESKRQDKLFLAINCAAIPEGLLESELFGSAKGAYTGSVADKKGMFEEADHGSLFLDEIGDMPPRLQTKLLRALQEKKIRRVGETQDRRVDVRIIAATNQPPQDLIRSGRMREDLFYRLNVIPITLPPLRERPEDIPLLIEAFLEKYALEGRPPKRISRDALKQLAQQPWPGNVRELENVIERACVLSPNDELQPADFDFVHAPVRKEEIFNTLTENYPTLQEIEEDYIRRVLEYTHYHKEKTAVILGINRRTLLRKEQLYGILRKSRRGVDAPLHPADGEGIEEEEEPISASRG
ncbi:MAG: sigma-54-dependent Fis family transcriptional regulator [Candidatus Lambdaproteobacteria bacterium]|nr:sigma-54-dependent Fis family transcriptional regulator [Candidatus Lambdaproteobacteria bacterium]